MLEKQQIEEIKEYALSNYDILDVERTKITNIENIEKHLHIDECFDRLNRGILFYPNPRNDIGHWVSILKQGNQVEVYDPYGVKVEKWEDKLGGISTKSLIDLIKKSGYKMISNTQNNQSFETDVNTCGRHAIIRILFYKYSLKEFNKILKNIKKETGIEPDEWVSAFTFELLGK